MQDIRIDLTEFAQIPAAGWPQYTYVGPAQHSPSKRRAMAEHPYHYRTSRPSSCTQATRAAGRTCRCPASFNGSANALGGQAFRNLIEIDCGCARPRLAFCILIVRCNMTNLLSAIVFALALGNVESATAQVYPSHPITMIVPFAAGAGTDVTARIVSEHMSRTLGQPIGAKSISGL